MMRADDARRAGRLAGLGVVGLALALATGCQSGIGGATAPPDDANPPQTVNTTSPTEAAPVTAVAGGMNGSLRR
ncbi:MAG TPA: hypothetical protein VG406_08270 [Isosphaeraceae bacterium]|nr:hypothetical protein [Isosphaeraceae bacterium]